jgi:hypothetical protein
MDRRASHGWCSLRVRFDAREIQLLKGAEQLRGVSLAQTPRPDVLRTALNLAKAGHKLASSPAGASVSLEESELGLLVDALRFASKEVQLASRTDNGQASPRRDEVLKAFPELLEKGLWRSFGLVRELDALALRLDAALNPTR